MNPTILSLAVCAVYLAGTATGFAQAQGESKYGALPWSMEEVRETYSEGFALVYSRSGTNEEGEAAGGTHSFEVTEADQWSVSIDNIWQDGGERHIGTDRHNWQDAVLLASFPGSSDTEFHVTGEDTVTVPAGTFETVVVEVANDYFKTRDTYWLVKDRPGVYAKWIDHGTEDEPAQIVMELEEVRSP